MTDLRCIDAGVLYRNPRPHVHSVHAYFPSVAVVGKDELVAGLVLGEAFESADLHGHLARSTDGGSTWSLEGEIVPRPAGRLTSDAGRLTALPGGRLLAFVVRHDRTAHPNEGLTNHENLGFAPTELLLARSPDGGRTWRPPRALEPPLAGPSFELCCPVVPLSDGRWILPTSTWRGWDGYCPNGMKMVALLSSDEGNTWPEYAEVMADERGAVLYWESKIVELPDGRLLATAWAYDESAARDLPNQYALSGDGGHTWTRPASTGLQGQTLTPLALADGRVLCVYRRIDESGLWACLARLDGERWVTDGQWPLWGARSRGLTASSENMAANFNVLRFGAPCLAPLADDTVYGAFWCYEDCVSGVRWFRLRID